MAEKLFTALQQKAEYLQKMYTSYAKSVTDEGLRKFLQSMAEQERSHRQYLKEEMEEVGELDESPYAEVLGAAEIRPNMDELQSYSRTDFLEHAMRTQEVFLDLYQRLSDACPTDELATFFHSMYIEERRHYSLVKDRYELEALL